MTAALRELVAARLAFLVTGGTGTGKTTLLSSLLSCVAPAERIVLVEDSGELAPDRPHVVRLEARLPNVEGAGGIGLRDLVRQALRMRPDRLVVGEVRGPEVVDLLAASPAPDAERIIRTLLSEILRSARNKGCVLVEAEPSTDASDTERWIGWGFSQGHPRLALDVVASAIQH
jgi:predicted ATP-dependent serine protease